jgi:hypothetical protein
MKLKINDPNPYPAMVNPETLPLCYGKNFQPQTIKNILKLFFLLIGSIYTNPEGTPINIQ